MKTAVDQELEGALKRLLAREVAGFRALRGSRQLTAGASQETWRIDIETDQGEESLALRRTQPTARRDSTIGTIGLDTEAALLQLAAAAGVPVPAVRCVLKEADGLGAGFITDWLEGETLGQRIVRAEELAALRETLAFQCGQALARIHALDWRAAGLERSLPVIDPAALVEETWGGYRDLELPVPMIDYARRWLQDHLPEDSRQCLVHGDFRNGNLMVSPGGIVGVLDWELAHVGDPLRDLGWLCVNSWRFGRRELPVGGFGQVRDLLDGYESVSGLRVPEESLLFWQVFGSFWWAAATLRMAHSWRTGETPSLERPVIGRRSSEAQMDCVNLLIPGGFDLPEAAAIDVGAQLPMPAELLQGVADFLKEDVAADADQHKSFLARVAANSLGIAQRELLLGPALAAAERRRLEALLGQGGELDALALGTGEPSPAGAGTGAGAGRPGPGRAPAADRGGPVGGRSAPLLCFAVCATANRIGLAGLFGGH